MDILIMLSVVAALCLVGLVYMTFMTSRLESRLMKIVMDVHDESRFYHNAGRSSAQHQLEIERLNIEKTQAESEKMKAEAYLIEEQRNMAKEIPGASDPRHGGKKHRRTVIESVGGPNG
jgi:hypothetical protein